MRRTHLAALLLLALSLALLGAGCLSGEETTATADKVVGTLPASTTSTEDLPALKLDGDPTAGKAVFTSAGLWRLPHSRRCGHERDRGAEPRRGETVQGARRHPRDKGMGPMPPFAGQLTDQQIADVAAYVTQATGG